MNDKTADNSPETAEKEGRVIDNPWRRLNEFTAARIGLGRSGVSLPTSEMLAFQLAHAQARDAVHTILDFDELCSSLNELTGQTPYRLHSRAEDRTMYLQRPDLGRRLDETSRETLQNSSVQQHFDLAIVIADGLSATAIFQNVLPFVEVLTAALADDEQDWTLAPISLVEQGRVAVGDEVGQCLNADIVLMLIGERPGLSSPDSLGLYLTWAPEVGLTDARRNCISNIRPQGLIYSAAVQRTLYLLKESRQLKISGVQLKDRSQSIDDKSASSTVEERPASASSNFLTHKP